MKHVEISELVVSAVIPVKMTRKEKLLRWAQLVRQAHRELGLYSNLEHMTSHQLRNMMIQNNGLTAFAIAVKDPEFAAQGLQSPSSLHDIITFFELSVYEAHVFSCDCGGYISNSEQARRIEGLAR